MGVTAVGIIVSLAVVMPPASQPCRGSAGERPVWPLWPGNPPDEPSKVGPERYVTGKGAEADIKRLTDVGVPTLTLYPPPEGKRTGTAVIVAPGGGYNILAIEHEGTQVCEWLNTLGITAALLKYRVPRRPGQTPDNRAMIQDAQRAVSLLRSRAAEWAIDPQRIGMIGFSAGGHLTAWVCLTNQRYYQPGDEHDRASPRPDFALLIYPAWLVDKEGRLKPEFTPDKTSPPMFFVHSSDDPISSESSVALYLALKKHGVTAELHVYAHGGHGYGMRKVPYPCASWPQRAADWLQAQGYLTTSSAKR
ncbi:MAG: alpha/beta hydrolase, partial [Gemmataceae bacterium]|nr:alpha/beta hydrolase [Gemmataceae bacterium]